jgi:hypothetical protein
VDLNRSQKRKDQIDTAALILDLQEQGEVREIFTYKIHAFMEFYGGVRLWVRVFYATLNNISVISQVTDKFYHIMLFRVQLA